MSATEARLPATLEAAVGRVKTTAAAAAERVVQALANQSQSAASIIERDLVMATQLDLRRKMSLFLLSFNDVLVDKVRREITPRHDSRRQLSVADWQTLSLVEDDEVEERMFSDRIGQQISMACEWQLRELSAYMASVLGLRQMDEERNPLRAEVLGEATYRAIEAVTTDRDARKLLAREFGSALAQLLPDSYTALVRELQDRGVQPLGLSLKTVQGPGNSLPGLNSGYQSIRGELTSSHSIVGDLSGPMGSDFVGGPSTGTAPHRGSSTQRPSLTGTGTFRSPSTGYGSGRGATGVGGLDAAGTAAAQADAQLMTLLRRLTYLASRPGSLDTGPASGSSLGSASGGGRASSTGGYGATGSPPNEAGSPLSGLMAVNLIRAHRDELMQASTGRLDHMVIDVVGSLFDQILSDPRVPPQMARQIARLQLPVLRVALADSSFFSSRRHPVRRFVNRLGSLACAFDDFDEGPGKQFLDRVRELVQEIVEGDFDQVEVYSAKLADLETFIAGQTETQVKNNGAATLLDSKESELRVQQRFMLQLRSALSGIAMPEYLRDFIAQVWSQALVHAIRRNGPESDLAKRFRNVARDLAMSVQPKGSPILRKRFLMQLPGLMKDLNEGLKLIGWPEAAQKEFFGKLLPSHADSLKAAPMSELDHNLLAKQLEGIFNHTAPGSDDFARADPVDLPEQEVEQRFSPEEAAKVGLVGESAVDWSGEVDIDLSADAQDTQDSPDSTDTAPLGLDVDINLDLAGPDPAVPTRGPQLFDHVRLGFAYQMLLKDQWQKVRLSYVSPGRSFFVFTRGRKHQETISLTARMLARMCEAGRMRAVESAYLMERATLRARRQLAALKTSSRH